MYQIPNVEGWFQEIEKIKEFVRCKNEKCNPQGTVSLYITKAY